MRVRIGTEGLPGSIDFDLVKKPHAAQHPTGSEWVTGQPSSVYRHRKGCASRGNFYTHPMQSRRLVVLWEGKRDNDDIAHRFVMLPHWSQAETLVDLGGAQMWRR